MLPRWNEELLIGAESALAPMPKTAHQFMVWFQEFMFDALHFSFFQGKERPGPVSNSEMRRWLANHSILLNGSKPGPDDLITLPITSFVCFPKKPDTRITII